MMSTSTTTNTSMRMSIKIMLKVTTQMRCDGIRYLRSSLGLPYHATVFLTGESLIDMPR